MSYALILYMVSLLVLFSNFYIQAYLMKISKANVKNGNSKSAGNVMKNDVNDSPARVYNLRSGNKLHKD